MAGFSFFLTAMCALFIVSAVVLLGVGAAQVARGRRQRAGIYFGLMLVASGVAAGFYFFGRLL